MSPPCTIEPRQPGRKQAVGPSFSLPGTTRTKAQVRFKDPSCVAAEEEMVPAGYFSGSGASSTSTQEGRPGAAVAALQEVASTPSAQAAHQNRQSAKREPSPGGLACASESQAAAGRCSKLPKRVELQRLHSHASADQDALSTADGLMDTEDDNAVALDAALLQPSDDTDDSCARPCYGSAGRHIQGQQPHSPPSRLTPADSPASGEDRTRAFEQQSSGKPRRSRPTSEPDSGSAHSQDSEPMQHHHHHQPKVFPARPKAISPPMGTAGSLPRGLLELAALAQQHSSSHGQPGAALSRQPSPSASSGGLALSATSAFTAVPKQHARACTIAGVDMSMQQPPAFPPAGLLHILYALPPPPLPYAMALPPPLHHIAGLVAPAGRLPAAADGSGKVSARQAALSKYLLKRKNRSFTKKVLYESRKRLADARPRVRGQFVKAGEGPAASTKAGGSEGEGTAPALC